MTCASQKSAIFNGEVIWRRKVYLERLCEWPALQKGIHLKTNEALKLCSWQHKLPYGKTKWMWLAVHLTDLWSPGCSLRSPSAGCLVFRREITFPLSGESAFSNYTSCSRNVPWLSLWLTRSILVFNAKKNQLCLLHLNFKPCCFYFKAPVTLEWRLCCINVYFVFVVSGGGKCIGNSVYYSSFCFD